MGAKALYIDTRNKIITQLALNNDIEAIERLLKDRESYYKYSRSWKSVNLDEYIEKFTITSDTYNMTTNNRKISFWDDGKKYEIVCAIGAKYFRIQRQPYIDKNGNRIGLAYVGLDLKEPSISGKFKGDDRKSERNRLTHFRMTHKKGTV